MSVHHAAAHAEHGAPFGGDAFGHFAESAARLFGTPQYIVGQTIVVIIWIALNGYALLVHFDPYPFILLNLAFSTQAAYAAPLILLAQTRQAARDKAYADAQAAHREDVAAAQAEQLRLNTAITEAVHALTADVHQWLAKEQTP